MLDKEFERDIVVDEIDGILAEIAFEVDTIRGILHTDDVERGIKDIGKLLEDLEEANKNLIYWEEQL